MGSPACLGLASVSCPARFRPRTADRVTTGAIPSDAAVRRDRFVVPFVLILAAAYGAGTQYLGACFPGWGPQVAQLSAPWLVIAFVAGCTQRTPGRAALLGLGATAAALVGYGLMTLSPVEGAHYALAGARGFIVSNEEVVVGGLVTGPLFGWFGQRWRMRGAIVGALATAAALCLEPLARHIPEGVVRAVSDGYLFAPPVGSHAVTLVEVAAGLTFAAFLLVRRAQQMRESRPVSTS